LVRTICQWGCWLNKSFLCCKTKDAVADQYRLTRNVTFNIIIHTAAQSIKLSFSVYYTCHSSTMLI
jgi:hypothetical protein